MRCTPPAPAQRLLRRHAENLRSPNVPVAPSRHQHSPRVGSLDLLRIVRFDPRTPPRPAARLDKAADSNAAAGEPLQIQARSREIALISFQDRNGEILGPAPPEIHVD